LLRSLITHSACAAAILLIVAGCATPPRPPEPSGRPAPRRRARNRDAGVALDATTAVAAREVRAGRVERAAGLVRRQRQRNLACIPRRMRGARRCSGVPRLWEAPCAQAMSVAAADKTAIRAFFERHFSPWQVTAADGGDTG
jgi:membrane-bound lytic murein transglycosylase A